MGETDLQLGGGYKYQTGEKRILIQLKTKEAEGKQWTLILSGETHRGRCIHA